MLNGGKRWSVGSTFTSFNKRFTTSGWRDIRIRKIENEVRNQLTIPEKYTHVYIIFYIIKQIYMFPIAGQTAGPIGMKFFVDTHGWPGGDIG